MQEDLRFDQYVARKLRAWNTLFPPTPRVAAGEDDSDEGQGRGNPGGAGEEGEEEDTEEAYALSDGE
jgi:hypothetical protein